MAHLIYLLLHFSILVLFFALVQRPAFIAYNRSVSEVPPTRSDLKDIYRHGLRTDLKVAAYLTGLPLFLLWAAAHFPALNATQWLIGYDLIAALLVGLLTVADTALYKFWQFKIEASVLTYLRTPQGAFASVSASYILTALGTVALTSLILAAGLVFAARITNPSAHALPVLQWWGHLLVAITALTIATVLFCIIRGLNRRPDTPVNAFYSNNQFFNHAAVNPIYNFIYSLSLTDDFGNQFQEFPAEYCREKFSSLFPTQGTPRLQLLNTERPNVVFIIWESLCARFIGTLGGTKGVMPHFDRLADEGILFTNCYAGSFRTDRGLVCCLSGYLGQPTTSVIKCTSKLPHLPGLPRTLRDKAGYHTMAVHGGNLNILHKSDYYWAVGHDTLVAQKDFPRTAPKGSWGVHDDYVFTWLADNLIAQPASHQPWFVTLQTLSSHEPFKVPYNRIPDNIVDNSFAYVDEAFGKFIDRLKASPVWKDLLVIVTGDHGVNLEYIGDKTHTQHLPLLMLGGAVKQPLRIDTIMNQTDIPATLLGQMGLKHDDFIFSRDVLADTYDYPFAFHTFNNGFIFRDATGITEYDNVAQRALRGHDTKREETAKVILQTLYADLATR